MSQQHIIDRVLLSFRSIRNIHTKGTDFNDQPVLEEKRQEHMEDTIRDLAYDLSDPEGKYLLDNGKAMSTFVASQIAQLVRTFALEGRPVFGVKPKKAGSWEEREKAVVQTTRLLITELQQDSKGAEEYEAAAHNMYLHYGQEKKANFVERLANEKQPNRVDYLTAGIYKVSFEKILKQAQKNGLDKEKAQQIASGDLKNITEEDVKLLKATKLYQRIQKDVNMVTSFNQWMDQQVGNTPPQTDFPSH